MKDNLLNKFQSLAESYDQLLSGRDGTLTSEQENIIRLGQRSAVRLPEIFSECVHDEDIRLVLIYDCASPFALHLQSAEVLLEGLMGELQAGQKKHLQRIQAISRELLEFRASLVAAYREQP